MNSIRATTVSNSAQHNNHKAEQSPGTIYVGGRQYDGTTTREEEQYLGLETDARMREEHFSGRGMETDIRKRLEQSSRRGGIDTDKKKRDDQSSGRGLEPETTMKKKLLSAWNKVKYGQKAWNTAELFQQAKFSSNSPVWLLGQPYHRKMLNSEPRTPPEGGRVGTFSETDCGIEAFQRDFKSRLWFTYRQGFKPLFGTDIITSDCGWGCMIRSGQMLLAQAVSLNWLGRDWRQDEGDLETIHKSIVRLFGDDPNAPLSIHKLIEGGKNMGVKPENWFGPSSVAHLLAKSVDAGSGKRGLLDHMVVHVAQDCAVYKQEIVELCSSQSVPVRDDFVDTSDYSLLGCGESTTSSNQSVPVDTSDYSLLGCSLTQEVVIDGSSWCVEQETTTSSWRPLVLLVPVRLGTDTLNPLYVPCIKSLLSLESCVGIMGGRPRHSLYFIGFQDENLIHLDPHRLQDVVDTSRQDFSLSSYHCTVARALQITKMDPSCCLGFLLKTRQQFDDWCENIGPVITPPQIAGLGRDYPMFVVSEGTRGDSGVGVGDWVSLSGEDSRSPSGSWEEGEEFVFL